jgi:hypothetical protein
MATKRLLNSIILIVLLYTSQACKVLQSSPTPDLSLIVAQTQTAMALEQLLTTTAMAQTKPTITPTTPVQPVPTNTIISTPIPDCTDKAKFISETIPDDTSFAPGESFVKTWTFSNAGTCIWTPDYSMVFVEGSQMNGASPTPIGKAIMPGDNITISLPLTAPQETGEHQGFWKLRNTGEQDFGLGKGADVAFWVKINVREDNDDLNLGDPTWAESFENNTSVFPLGEGDSTIYKVEDGSLIMTAKEPAGDLWRVATIILQDYYLESRFKTGKNCSGKDSYGLIVRAPEQPDNIIDSGYIFSFSCDGNYRAYLMVNGEYNNIISWTKHPNIKIGPEQENIMGIRAKGKVMQLYANNTLLYEFTDESYLSGLFGLVIRADETTNLQILVQRVAYWLNP